MEVKECTYEDLKPFILNIHYAHLMPTSIMYKYGLYDKGELVGVCTYGRPAAPAPSNALAGPDNRKKVIELNRLVLLPDYNGGNCASYLIAHSLKRLPSGLFVLSYADIGGQGHPGYVYQATNWVFTGVTKPRRDRSGYSGNHARHYIKGSQLHMRTPKCRYVNFTGDRRTKRQLKRLLRWKELPYIKSLEDPKFTGFV